MNSSFPCGFLLSFSLPRGHRDLLTRGNHTPLALIYSIDEPCFSWARGSHVHSRHIIIMGVLWFNKGRYMMRVGRLVSPNKRQDKCFGILSGVWSCLLELYNIGQADSEPRV